MKSVFEELGGTYTSGRDGMFYPNQVVDESDQHPIGRWGRMHKAYLEKDRPGLYARLILNGTLQKHLADVNRRAEVMMEQLTEQMKNQEGITERLKEEQPMVWIGRMNSIRSRAEEIVREEIVNSL